MQTKTCKKCGKELPATTDCFYKTKNTLDGLHGSCKECMKADARTRWKNYYPQNKEKLYETKKIYRKENEQKYKESTAKYRITNRKKINLQQRKYYIENKEKILERTRKYAQDNKELYKKWNIEWKKKNRDKQSLYNHQRKAKMNKLPHSLSVNEWQIIKNDFNHCCAYCGKHSKSLSQEHFIPVSRHGEYTKHNIIPACQSCNSSKNAKPFEEWYPEQPFYSKERERFIYEHFTKMAEENGGWGRSRPDLGTLTIIIKEYQA